MKDVSNIDVNVLFVYFKSIKCFKETIKHAVCLEDV